MDVVMRRCETISISVVRKRRPKEDITKINKNYLNVLS